MITDRASVELKAVISLLGQCCDLCEHDRGSDCNVGVVEKQVHGDDCFFFEEKK